MKSDVEYTELLNVSTLLNIGRDTEHKETKLHHL